MFRPVLLTTLCALLTACSTSPAYHLTYDPPARPPITAVLTVTIDDTRASNTPIRYSDPVSGLVKTDTAIYGWSRTLGPYSSVTGDLWLQVDNRIGRATAHCSIAVTGHPVVTAAIPVGQADACAVHLP